MHRAFVPTVHSRSDAAFPAMTRLYSGVFVPMVVHLFVLRQEFEVAQMYRMLAVL